MSNQGLGLQICLWLENHRLLIFYHVTLFIVLSLIMKWMNKWNYVLKYVIWKKYAGKINMKINEILSYSWVQLNEETNIWVHTPGLDLGSFRTHMFSSCLCGFSAGSLVSLHSPKSCMFSLASGPGLTLRMGFAWLNKISTWKFNAVEYSHKWVLF